MWCISRALLMVIVAISVLAVCLAAKSPGTSFSAPAAAAVMHKARHIATQLTQSMQTVAPVMLAAGTGTTIQLQGTSLNACTDLLNTALQAAETSSTHVPDQVSGACRDAQNSKNVYDPALAAVTSSSAMSVNGVGQCTDQAQSDQYAHKLPAACAQTYSYTDAARASFKSTLASVTTYPGKMLAVDTLTQERVVLNARLKNGTVVADVFSDFTDAELGTLAAIPQACTISDLQTMMAQVTNTVDMLTLGFMGYRSCVNQWASDAGITQLKVDSKLSLTVSLYPNFDDANKPLPSPKISGTAIATSGATPSLVHGDLPALHVCLLAMLAAAVMWHKVQV